MIQSVEQILPSLRRPGAQLELLPGWRRKVKTERLERREERGVTTLTNIIS